MLLETIKPALDRIQGCTFATLDAETVPSPGIRKVVTGCNVALFNSKVGVSGYESMVKKRLALVGIDPDSFSVGDLPWGERDSGPLIENYGKHYLQCVVLSPGSVSAFIGAKELDASEPAVAKMLRDKPSYAGGLPPELAVRVRTWNIANLTRLVIFGEEILS